MAKVESRCVPVPSPSTYISLASLDIYPGNGDGKSVYLTFEGANR